jgi:peptidoglycan hydrolase-like protein with peptidoglycan-binding domain
MRITVRLLAPALAVALAIPAISAHEAAASEHDSGVARTQPVLRSGDRGAAVRLWQSTLDQLAAQGKPSQPRISIDGVFGPMSVAATMAFQRYGGVRTDGIVGSRTRAVAATALASAALGSKSHRKPVPRQGSRGPAVRNWQSTLNQLTARSNPSRPRIAIDGVFGPRTCAATLAFQRWAGIAADGIVGVDTYAQAAKTLA